MTGQGISFCPRTISESQLGTACPGVDGKQMFRDPDVATHTLLQSSVHVEERVGNAAEFSQDLGVQLLMVLEHLVHVKCQEVLGHTAYI